MFSSQEARHLFAFAVHFSAFWFLLGFALAEDSSLNVYKKQFWWVRDKFSLTPRRWYFQCVNSTGQLNSTLLDCNEDDRRFYVKRDPSESVTYINVLVLACLYVAWSACGHLISAFVVEKQRIIRWLDYAVTAPTMLVVVSVAFGSDSLTAIVLAPSILAVLLVIAGILEPNWSLNSYEKYCCVCSGKMMPIELEMCPDRVAGLQSMSYYRLASIAMLFLAYIPVMVPSLYASYDITVDHAPGTGTAPDFVFAFSVAITLFFSSFAAVYLWDLIWPIHPERRERIYIFLSMVSKTSLHLFLGLAVIGQSNNVGIDAPSEEEDDMDTLAIGLGGVAALVAGLGVVYNWFDYIFGYESKYSLIILSEYFY